MKRLRLIFIALGAPALLLLGVHEFGGTPISKGYETGFEWHVDPPNNRLVLTADAEGSMTCWLVMEMPANIPAFKVETSSATHLRAYQKSSSGSTQMVAIVKDVSTPETAFDWPSGTSLYISPQDRSSVPSQVGDWYVYLSNKTYDSSHRSKWRKTLFRISIILFVFALIATTIEAVEKARAKEEPLEWFSPEYCLKQLIIRVEGASSEQSKQMQTLLQQVLIGGVDLRNATASWKMSTSRKLLLQKKAFQSLQNPLGQLVNKLPEYLKEIQSRLL
ncbi:MAG TPA: hypothetical protein VGF44_17480 [Terriglobales bacterium]|jgi:hypothetical protein